MRLVQALAHGLEEDPAGGDVPVPGIGCPHDHPRRLARARFAQDVLGDVPVAVVGLELREVIVGHPPARARVVQQVLQAPPLLLAREVEPDLDEQHALVGEHGLEVPDLLQQPVEVAVVDPPRGAEREQLEVPGVEEERDLAARGQREPVPPRRRPLALEVVATVERVGEDVARVEPLVQPVGGLAPPAAADAGEERDGLEAPALEETVLRLEQRLPQLRHLLLVLGLVELVADLRRFEHSGQTPCEFPGD